MDDVSALRRKLIRKAKARITEKYGEKDVHIIRAVNLLDDLDSIFNLLAENAREWYSAHFPELNALARDNAVYLQLAAGIGRKEKFTKTAVEKVFGNKEKAVAIAGKAGKSIGSEISENALGEIQALCRNALELKKQRESLTSFVEDECAAMMPNFSALAGKLLAARLLNEAGSFRKLALMPSSTVQLLGAEKALFKHLRSGAKPPKYGLLYQHPMVRQASGKNSGKIARSLAGKLSIAVRADYFGKKDIVSGLQKELKKRMDEISR